jgi:hypothetical protein
MHTPGHAVVNVAFLGTCTSPSLAAPILAGAIVPDLPIFYLFARERWLRRTPEAQIWADHYQRRFWQNLIHGTHSVPLAIAGAVLGLALGWGEVAAFFSSALLHSAADLPVHVQDAHRHFLPFSHYRFVSPFSYWDARYHARYIALIELAMVWAGSVVLFSWELPAAAVVLLIMVDAWYPFNYYRSFLRRAPEPDPHA